MFSVLLAVTSLDLLPDSWSDNTNNGLWGNSPSCGGGSADFGFDSYCYPERSYSYGHVYTHPAPPPPPLAGVWGQATRWLRTQARNTTHVPHRSLKQMTDTLGNNVNN
eukprot:CAMPEP_0175889296 /NCGR_PEP_ID=MMETSP0107_2-20121207/47182_1 /TAXON_ID=195067 ORGANISM="Goniomonas pacifica, Strain CCMP1869" /NCGR_SAMPLE_ID=MMETSP0107_2 /ASSEMBLY_ACC=CAM_ASM_000203 /LENGTH=107 /DNA_ID=CAMNT_0017209911 /DNA_START=94 /DNA_END=416 /DNA_ORIENTATION=+